MVTSLLLLLYYGKNNSSVSHFLLLRTPLINATSYYDYQLNKAQRKFSDQVLNVKIALLSRETGSVSSSNLSAFNVIGSKAREIVGDATGDARLLTLPKVRH